MKKAELEQQNQKLREQCGRLASLLRSTQARALGCSRFLEQGLQADTTCEESGSEQVARCDEAMKRTLVYLARIVDPAAQTQDQADQTMQQFKEKGPQLADELKQYITGVLEEPLSQGETAEILTSIGQAMAKSMGNIALYVDDPDERSDISPLTEAWQALCEAVALTQSLNYSNSPQATISLKSLIEAAEDLNANMCESGEAYDDHMLEETFGQLYPDVQRVNAAITAAKEYLTDRG